MDKNSVLNIVVVNEVLNFAEKYLEDALEILAHRQNTEENKSNVKTSD